MSDKIIKLSDVSNGALLITMPSGNQALIIGGPYYNKPDSNFVGVKMAVEVDMPCDINVPTEDFSVPDVQVLRRALIKAVVAMSKGKTLYIGCMGGIGRTGLFIAALIRIFEPYENPVLLTRQAYLLSAVETIEQQDFIHSLPLGDIIELAQLA